MTALRMLPLVNSPGAKMSAEDQIYHRDREQQCRNLAKRAADPEIRRRHEELANLHASRAALYGGGNSGQMSA